MKLTLSKRAQLLLLSFVLLIGSFAARELVPDAIPIDSLEPVEIDLERLSQFKNMPTLEGEETTYEDGTTEVVWNSRSPFTINDMTIEEHEASLSVASKLGSIEHGNPRRGLYNTTEQSNECKLCIDNTFKWCPTSNY